VRVKDVYMRGCVEYWKPFWRDEITKTPDDELQKKRYTEKHSKQTVRGGR